MTSTGRAYVLDYWRVATLPSLAIVLVSLRFNLLGDGLRDVLDLKQRSPLPSGLRRQRPRAPVTRDAPAPPSPLPRDKIAA